MKDLVSKVIDGDVLNTAERLAKVVEFLGIREACNRFEIHELRDNCQTDRISPPRMNPCVAAGQGGVR